jgi:hypothetical protein
MKPISTKVHGVLDYLWAGMVPILPQLFDCSPGATRLLTGSALGALSYSLLTRYELGAVKLLPMQTHLALDTVSAILLITAPLTILREKRQAKALLLALGLFELAVVLASQTESSAEHKRQQLDKQDLPSSGRLQWNDEVPLTSMEKRN